MLAKEGMEIKKWNLNLNIDTYVEKGQMKYENLQEERDLFLAFMEKGDHWSFVKLNKSGKAVEVREKERISEFCTLGAYYFSSCALYEDFIVNTIQAVKS